MIQTRTVNVSSGVCVCVEEGLDLSTLVALTGAMTQLTAGKLVAIRPFRANNHVGLWDDNFQPGRTKQEDGQKQEADKVTRHHSGSIGHFPLDPLREVGWRHLG